MGGGPDYPKPSKEELALTSQQTELLRNQTLALQEQMRRQDLLAPVLMEQVGLRPVYTNGQITGFERFETPEQQLRTQEIGFQGEALGFQRQMMEQSAGLQAEGLALQRKMVEQGAGALTRQEAAQAEQLGILRKQTRLQDMLTPLMLEQTGYQVQRDPATGDIVGVSKRPLTEYEQLSQQIQLQLAQRTKAALEGRLDVDPATTRELGLQEQALHERLAQQLGPGYATSTPGIQALGDFTQRKETILQGARRGDISLGQQLLGAQSQLIAGERGQSLGQLGGILAQPLGSAQAYEFPGSRGLPGMNFAGMGRSGGMLGSGATLQEMMMAVNAPYANLGGGGGGSNLLDYYANNRAREAQANAQQSAASAQFYGTLGGVAGGAIGGAFFGPPGMALGSALGGAAGSYLGR